MRATSRRPFHVTFPLGRQYGAMIEFGSGFHSVCQAEKRKRALAACRSSDCGKHARHPARLL